MQYQARAASTTFESGTYCAYPPDCRAHHALIWRAGRRIAETIPVGRSFAKGFLACLDGFNLDAARCDLAGRAGAHRDDHDRARRWIVYTRTAERLGIALEPDELWLLARIGELNGRASKPELEQRLRIPDSECTRLLAQRIMAGMAMQSAGEGIELTEKGRSDYRRLVEQCEQYLRDMLAGWNPDEHSDVRAMMRELANSFASTPPACPSNTA